MIALAWSFRDNLITINRLLKQAARLILDKNCGNTPSAEFNGFVKYYRGGPRILERGVQPWRTLKWNELAKPTRRHQRHCWGEGVRGVKPPLAAGSWGASPRKFSTFWCFLLQSRHSSALLPGLLRAVPEIILGGWATFFFRPLHTPRTHMESEPLDPQDT